MTQTADRVPGGRPPEDRSTVLLPLDTVEGRS